MTFARKINKIPKLEMIIVFFFLGGGGRGACFSAPLSYAYVSERIEHRRVCARTHMANLSLRFKNAIAPTRLKMP